MTDLIREDLLFQLAEAEGELINAGTMVRDARMRLESAQERIESIRIQLQIHEMTKAKLI